MPSELEELIEFLHSPQAQIREIALENLVQFSPAGTNQNLFKYDNSRAIKDLKDLAQDKSSKIAKNALTTLANLCDDKDFRSLIVKDESFSKYLVQEVINLTNENADLICILLTNMAKHDEVLSILNIQVDLKQADQNKFFKSTKAMDCLMDLFVNGFDRSLNKFASFDYLGYFFADISRFPNGRHYFVREQEYDNTVPLSKILKFTECYETKIRREGVCSAIKNSLFETEQHLKLLTDEKINLLPYILGPLAFGGNKGLDEEEISALPVELRNLPDDKEIELLDDVICVHLESLLLICVTREGREYLRGKSTYPLVRELHKSLIEGQELCLELCDRVVQMLMRDEPPTAVEIDAMHSDDESDEEDDDDKITEIL